MYEQLRSQGYRCAISGVELKVVRNGTQTASLDRIDSSKGYTRENIQWLHKDVNLMKRNMTDENFVQWCKVIAEHRK